MIEQPLWHDTWEEALMSVIHAVGGPKKMAAILWPTKFKQRPEATTRYLNQTLDPDRAEKLALCEIEQILTEGRNRGCHIGVQYLAKSLTYTTPEPVDPEDEKARLQREYIESVKEMQNIAKRLEGLNGS